MRIRAPALSCGVFAAATPLAATAKNNTWPTIPVVRVREYIRNSRTAVGRTREWNAIIRVRGGARKLLRRYDRRRQPPQSN